MKRRNFSKAHSLSTESSLQMAPMASVFVVILVFLLKSVAQGSTALIPDSEITLPFTQQADDFQDTLKIEISPSRILVDDQVVGKLNQFVYDPSDLSENGGFKSVSQAIAKEREKTSVAGAQKNVVIVADQLTPYQVLKRVVASISSGGYKSVKLAVVKDS
jgi:biopolymer transport protein ExbD